MSVSRLARGRRSLTVVLVILAAVISACSPAKDKTTPSARQAPRTPVPVIFEVPAGFARTTSYRILVPLHPVHESQWVLPTGTLGLDVIAVTSYALDRDVADDRYLETVTGYAGKVAATSTTTPVRTTVADHPAFQLTIVQPSSQGPLAYDATFVFAGPNLVQVMCQHDNQPEVVKAACATVLQTLRIQFT